jgi:hypothetical protein
MGFCLGSPAGVEPGPQHHTISTTTPSTKASNKLEFTGLLW